MNMKFTINYDILYKIYRSENGKGFLHHYKIWFKGANIGTVLSIPVIMLVLNDNNKLPRQLLINYISSLILGIPFAASTNKHMKEKEKNVANIELILLLFELSKLEIDTSLDLLKESKTNDVKRIIKYEDDFRLPKIKEYKYIDVPLNNGFTETILQEHVLGTENYEISIGVPEKKKKLIKQIA